MFRLPRDPNLDQLKNQARDLQRRVRAGEAEAVALVRELSPRATPSATFALSRAQHALAKAYGFASWPALKRHVETVGRFARSPHLAGAGSPADELARLACLTYGGDDPQRWAQARELHAARPELVRSSISGAAAMADLDAVRELLAAEPGLARRSGGPFDWEPLLYVTCSRAGTGDPVAVARLLLAHGADPDAGFLWEGHAPPFTALTGAFGGGEGGRTQPPHPAGLALAGVLLAAGADPNDGQTLYNRHFEPADDHLELLFAHGLGRGDGGPWKLRLGDAQATPRQMLEDQLVWAAGRDLADRVELLLRHGVDPDGLGTRHPATRGRRALELAVAAGSTRIPALLLAAGAAPLALDPVTALIAHAMRGDRAEVDTLLARDPGLAAEAVRRSPGQVREAAAHHRADAVRLLVALGFDPSHRDRTTALHEAAWAGDAGLVELLLALGADPTVRDTEHEGTPDAWARYNQHPEVAARLEQARVSSERA